VLGFIPTSGRYWEGRIRVMLLVAASTGVRAGELHAMRWRHFNFDRREA
jgi:integrase